MKLRKYQEDAILKLVTHKGFGLFLDMGLGKTIIVLKAIHNLKFIKKINRVLIIAPKRVVDHVWGDEARKWDVPLTFIKLNGPPKQREINIKKKVDIYMITPDLINWLVDQKEFFHTIVVDEISMFRSTKSNRYKNLYKLRSKSQYLWGLTGTPAPNGIDKIWGIIKLLDYGERLGKYKKNFQDEYLIPDIIIRNQVVKWRLKKGAEDLIADKIKDICISMKSSEELPDFQTIILYTKLDKKVHKAYKKFVRDQVIFYENGDLVAFNPAVLVTKLQQFANGHTYLDTGEVQFQHYHKYETLTEITESYEKPILLWVTYKVDQDIIKRHLHAEDLDVDKWNMGKQRLAIAHPQSAGHGLNLQSGGCVMVWFGPIWNLELYQQAIKRLHRSGQENKVFNYIICAKNTIDERIIRALDKKAIVQEHLLDMLRFELGGEASNG